MSANKVRKHIPDATNEFLTHPTLLQNVDAETLAYLQENQPAAGSGAYNEVGHWIAHTVACLGQIQQLKKRIQELEKGGGRNG